MSHLSYYQYQTTARGIVSAEDVKRICANHRHFYDQIVLPWLPRRRDARIAELACGHGSFLHWLDLVGYTDVVGVDLSVEQTRMASQVCSQVHTEDALPWLARQEDASLDAILGVDFAEHISKDEFISLLDYSARTLRPGGVLILRVPNGDSPFVGRNLFNDITHVWCYTTVCLATLGKMHGLSESVFEDEGVAAIRDHRWIKVPIARVARWVLSGLVFLAARTRGHLWNPHLWACLRKPTAS